MGRNARDAVAAALAAVFAAMTEPLAAEVFYSVRYVYNNAGNLVAIRRYTNETAYVERTYEYDALGRKTKETDEVGNALQISYDAVGNIVEMRGSAYPIKCVMDIGVKDNLSASSKWGVFYVPPSGSHLYVGDCEVIIHASILLREDLDLQGDRNTTYFYTPHTPGGAGGNSGSSTGRPQVRGAILAHERGHASAFLHVLIPKFKAALQKFGNRKLSAADKAEVRRIYNRCKREAQAEDSRRTNEAHENWHRDNGFNIQIRR